MIEGASRSYLSNLWTMREFGVGVVVGSDIDVSCFSSVAVTVHGVRLLCFVIGKGAEVLRPISKGGGCVGEGVRTSYVG